MTTELTLLGEEPSAAVVLRSTRHQPGLLVQADTLSAARRTAADLVRELERGDLEDARYSARELVETLQDWVTAYERMMRAAGHDLPYAK